MITQDFDAVELRRILAAPGIDHLFDQKCDHCGKPYRFPPCENSDHYRTCLKLGMEEADKPWISFGCLNPTQQQAARLPNPSNRRHPYNGKRPEYSGYCTVRICTCQCHQNDALTEMQEV